MRDWAVETGRVENLYYIQDSMAQAITDRGLSSVALSRHENGLGFVDPSLMILNHYDIIKTLRSEDFPYLVNNVCIRGLHAMFDENQDFAVGRTTDGRHVSIKLLKGV
jgi:hypothetical protein